jgi:pimeloyl-ACP methyl ester carboxylesterase
MKMIGENQPARMNPMSKISAKKVFATIVGAAFVMLAGCSQLPRQQGVTAEIGFVDVDSGMKLRRLVVHNPRPEATVLFLHGFPETLHAWKDISLNLGKDYEVHAFDWPGYGLSSRPPVEQFSYAPKDYAQVLKAYIRKSGIDTSKLVIYATDIGALPVLLLALDEPNIAREIIVGDFAPFDRPQYMYESLQNLKSKPSSEAIHAYMNKTRDEILENAFRRGLPKEEQFEVSREFKDDMFKGWSQNGMTSADAFYHYYSNFTRDQNYFESNLNKLKTPIKVIWGDKDVYIKKEMGVEFGQKIGVSPMILSGIGHYPHLQKPEQTVEEIRISISK